MARICYIPKRFTPEHTAIIAHANRICERYAGLGLTLTLRQLFYQYVQEGLIPNAQNEYKRLGDIVGDARMAGELDWDYLIDRTRNVVSTPHWKDAADVVQKAAEQYRTDLWEPQKVRPFVFIEKDAAIGVVESVCDENSVPYFSCRGYASVSEIWSFAQRIRYYIENGEQVVILHIGDHDPSGLDMTRDLQKRLNLFVTRDWLMLWGQSLPRPVSVGDIKDRMRGHMREHGSHIRNWESPWTIRRLALNYDQVETYNPPPNPAKTTDARYERYVEETGLYDSWELDALDPVVLQDLIQEEIDAVRDLDMWGQALATMEEDRDTLKKLAEKWGKVKEVVNSE
jgi:hypothetical protein